MRIYSDTDLNVLYIEGVSQGPVDSYRFMRDGDLISAFRPQQSVYDFVDLPWFAITDRNGLAFDNVELVNSYLDRLIIAQFPLRFTVSYPLQVTDDDVEIDQTFIKSLSVIDGGFG